MLGENHSVHHEFPEKRALIDKLLVENMHFKKIAGQYDSLDKEIRGIEQNNSPIDDTTFHEMKKKRSHMKDELYQMLLQHS